MGKDEYATVIEYLPYGFSDSTDRRPIAVLLTDSLSLLSAATKRNAKIEVGKRVYIGEGKRDEIHHIISRISFEKLNEEGKNLVRSIVEKHVKDNEAHFVDLINKLGPINVRLHSIELIPNFGSKLTQKLLDERKKQPFTSYDDINKRVAPPTDIRKEIEDRIIEEMAEKDKYRLFT
ncbi:MAG: DUF655 domain-containing protein [Nanoarchaeota archaeon]|nr:DUF655 domain-containing protein [Nanoarchaeota archaeon]